MSDLDHLARDFAFAAGKLADRVHHVLEESGERIVAEARGLAPKGPPAQHYPDTITADVSLGDKASLVLEVGPDRQKNGQAKLGNIFEYGTSTLPPKAHLGPAGEHELPNLEEHLAEAGSKVL